MNKLQKLCKEIQFWFLETGSV